MPPSAPERRGDIEIRPGLYISETDLDEAFIRASGPGGQNVNKVATAVQLRFDLANAALPADMKARARRLAGRRLTAEGVLVIEASSHRTQAQNRVDARARLVELLQKAAERPKPRKKTKPTLASKKRRLDDKARRGVIKARRKAPPTD